MSINNDNNNGSLVVALCEHLACKFVIHTHLPQLILLIAKLLSSILTLAVQIGVHSLKVICDAVSTCRTQVFTACKTHVFFAWLAHCKITIETVQHNPEVRMQRNASSYLKMASKYYSARWCEPMAASCYIRLQGLVDTTTVLVLLLVRSYCCMQSKLLISSNDGLQNCHFSCSTCDSATVVPAVDSTCTRWGETYQVMNWFIKSCTNNIQIFMQLWNEYS